MDKENSYYVYKHTFQNNTYYIGKGTKGRSKKFKNGRSRTYLEDLEKYGPPTVTILHENLTETEAYEIEHKLINESRARGDAIHNRTDGLEKSEIGDMPWRTLIFSDHKKIHPKYKQIIHLASTENKGSYCIATTIVEAAIKLRCSCNEVIEFINAAKSGNSKEKNGYALISEDEAIKIAHWCKNEIIQMTKDAELELQKFNDINF